MRAHRARSSIEQPSRKNQYCQFGNILQNNVVFTPGALSVTFRLHFTPSAKISLILMHLDNEKNSDTSKTIEIIVFKLHAVCFLEAVRTMCYNVEVCENHRKPSTRKYPTKINGKSCFEHVQVTLIFCKIYVFHARCVVGHVQIIFISSAEISQIIEYP